jgi:hypothetical protein
MAVALPSLVLIQDDYFGLMAAVKMIASGPLKKAYAPQACWPLYLKRHQASAVPAVSTRPSPAAYNSLPKRGQAMALSFAPKIAASV